MISICNSTPFLLNSLLEMFVSYFCLYCKHIVSNSYHIYIYIYIYIYMRCGIRAMRLTFYLPKFFFFFFFSSNINVIPFKIVLLVSYTPIETLPLLVGMPYVFNRYGVQHVRYTLLDVL